MFMSSLQSRVHCGAFRKQPGQLVFPGGLEEEVCPKIFQK